VQFIAAIKYGRYLTRVVWSQTAFGMMSPLCTVHLERMPTVNIARNFGLCIKPSVPSKIKSPSSVPYSVTNTCASSSITSLIICIKIRTHMTVN